MSSLNDPTNIINVTFRADLNGAYFQDTKPSFPPPEHLLPRFRLQRHDNHSRIPIEDFVMEKVSEFCFDVRAVQDLMRAESQQRNLWTDTIFPGYHISPILGDLLAFRPEVDETNIATVTLEAFRLAAILYISNLRAKFGIDTLSGDLLYVTKLYNLLSPLQFNQALPPMILIWILSVVVTSQCLPEHRKWCSDIWTEVVVSQNLLSFANLMSTIGQIVWDEELLSVETESLKRMLEA
jgi:hypothetical protein